jgi:taurine--2-oxoglutarate transaminase
MELDELVFHPWTAQGPRDVLTVVSGSGSDVIDADGRRYLDFSSQLVFTNLGHQHPRIVARYQAASRPALHACAGPRIRQRGEAARMIVDVAPAGHVLFTTGQDGGHRAVRMARVHTGRPKAGCSRHNPGLSVCGRSNDQ